MKTDSSISGLHYGNHAAHTFSLVISSVKCNLTNLAVKNSSPLERRKRGVSIILDKAPGTYTVEKLRALLLMEAGVNGLHKINFNRRLMPSLEASPSTPQQIIGDRKITSYYAFSF